jgi:hypothetical protein
MTNELDAARLGHETARIKAADNQKSNKSLAASSQMFFTGDTL